MAQATDIVLNSAGYMLAPGSSAYVRTQDGIAEGRTGRIQLKDFFGGQRRPYQLERDKTWRGLSVGPTYGGQGIEPWPYVEAATLPASWAIPQYSTRIPWASVDDYVFLSTDNVIRRIGPISSSTFTLADGSGQSQTITSMTYYSGKLLLSKGTGSDIQFFSYPLPASGTSLLAGEQGTDLVSYAGFALWIDARASQPGNQIRLVTGSGVETRWLDNDIRRLVTVDNKVMAITQNGLYSFTGRVKDVLIPNPAWTSGGSAPVQIPGKEWSGEFEPFFQHGNTTGNDDYEFVLGFGGRIYAWYGKTVMEFNPNGDRAGWRDTGLSGQQCDGACVAGGYLLVTIKTHRSRSQLWAWDGSGWWLILDRTDFENNRLHHPIPINGHGGFDAIVFQHNTREYYKLRLIRREYPTGTTPSAAAPQSGEASITSSLIDCGERDKDKAWRKIGAVFADPDPDSNASADSVTVKLEYSIDNGFSWTVADTQVIASNQYWLNQFTLDADIASAAAVSRWLQLRVSWSSLSAWAPILTGIWAEFEMLDSPARRRKWHLTVQADDELIDRSAALLGKTGREIVSDLWEAWQTGTTVTFRDIDYDAVSIERNVRIIGITESTDRPSDAGAWGHSKIKLTLVEV